MTSHGPSLIRQLQVGFALGALLILGTFAGLMDLALHRSLAREDALVLEAQAAYLAQASAEGKPLPGEPGSRPEKVEWSLRLDARPERRSPGFALLPQVAWPSLPMDGRAREMETSGGGEVSALRMRIPGGELRLLMDQSHEEALVASFRRVLWIGTLLASAASALLARLVAAWGLRPLRLLVEETATVRPGDPFHPLEASRFPEELGPLVHSLNEALARLQEAIRRLDEMGSELAHELRTPLQHLRSSLEDLALRREALPPQALGPALEACDRLQSLIEGILFLAHSEDPTASVPWKDLDAASLLEETRGFFEGVAEEGGVTLSVDAPRDLRLQGDPALITRALHNLVSNALAATPAGGRISLQAESTDEGLALRVLDDGHGLPSFVRDNVGARWNRGLQSRGHGLGLAIVRSILVRHGGAFTLGDRPGGGTVASLYFAGSSHLKKD